MLRQLLVLLLLTHGIDSYADDLCNASRVATDQIRISESDFTKDNAEKSLKALSNYVNGSTAVPHWTTVPNLALIIEGYLLKQGIPEKTKGNEAARNLAVDNYCNFIYTKAYFHD